MKRIADIAGKVCWYILEVTVSGYIVYFKYMIFGIIAGVILSPVLLMLDEYHYSWQGKSNLVIALALALIFFAVPAAFHFASRITGFFRKPQVKKQVLSVQDEETGFMTEYRIDE